MAWRSLPPTGRAATPAATRAAAAVVLFVGAGLLLSLGHPPYTSPLGGLLPRSIARRRLGLGAGSASSNSTSDWHCSNTCFTQFGFQLSDCSCDVHGSWYMWVCSTYQGQPIETQFCGMRNCGGCHAVATPAATTVPEAVPSPLAGEPAGPGAADPTPEEAEPSHAAAAPAAPAVEPGPVAPEERPHQCAGDWQACMDERCCQSPGFTCFQKNEWWGQCRPACSPGIHADEPPRYQVPWTCTPLGASWPAPAPTSWTPQLPNRSASEWGYHPLDGRLLRPSTAEKKTFYMYRVQGKYDYAPENQNMANLAGALWYLHNEIVNNRYERRFRKTRIQRFKVTTKATQPMVDDGTNWGVRFAFDLGQCTGPWQCTDAFERYGYFVGCNKVDEFPNKHWKDQVFYPNAIWYSLPGKCSTRLHNQHSEECELEEPGGACEEVTGAGNCTYAYAPAGEISIDELEGIQSFRAFADAGGWEYNNKTDKGVQMTFWDDKHNTTACEDRLDLARGLFEQKYANESFQEELPEPSCDFNFWRFYAHVPQNNM